jgi:hypothetical protein
MTFKEKIAFHPHRFLFQLSLIIGATGFMMQRYDKHFGQPFDKQGDFEQFFRLLIGSLILYVPILLILALVYWLMHKYKRPTLPKFNQYHIYLLCIAIIYNLGYSVIQWLIDSPVNYKADKGISQYIGLLLSGSAFVIFVYNIFMSLYKPNTHLIKEDIPEEK